ncbi:DNA polymerase eta [Armadillidium vulgare]|nr:DNA polymerase eta [Armadillidium vulgare]
MSDRLIILLDMDCFYVQVEERDNPEIKGQPAAVVQYNTWKGGGIIAVNYEARSFGVKRGMRGDEAKDKCPTIHLVQVPVQRGKADLTKYRNAGKEVISVLSKFSDNVERASIDEAYIDFTKAIERKIAERKQDHVTVEDLSSTWVVGYDDDETEDNSQSARKIGLESWLNKLEGDEEFHEDNENIMKLSVVAEICEEMRRTVLQETGFKCSAGISHNKMLAKLACGLHKPNQQTVLPMESVPLLWSKTHVSKVRNLGGKLGDSVVKNLGCETMHDLSKLTLNQLKANYDDKTAQWLFSVGKGIDSETVTQRQLPKSIACSKNFNGKDILDTKEKINTWMKSLSEELSERLEEDRTSNDRLAKTLTVYIRLGTEEMSATTRSCSLPSYKAEVIAKVALSLIANVNTAAGKDLKWDPPVRNISLSASPVSPAPFSTTNPSLQERASQSVSESSSVAANVKKGKINSQKSFFLQFLSQNTSERIKKKFHQNSDNKENLDDEVASENSTNKTVDQSNCDNLDSNESDDEDSKYDKSTDDEEEVKESPPVEVIDISSASSSPILSSKKLHSSSLRDSNNKQPVNGNILPKKLANSNFSHETPSCSVSVNELFPDLDNVDTSVVEMLPIGIKDKVYEVLKKRKKLESDENDIEIIPET